MAPEWLAVRCFWGRENRIINEGGRPQCWLRGMLSGSTSSGFGLQCSDAVGPGFIPPNRRSSRLKRLCFLLQFYSHLLLYSEPYLFMGRLGSDLTVGEFTTSSPGLLLSSFPYGWVWVFHGWAWVFQFWSSAHFNLFMYGLNLKIPAATLPRTFDLHLVYDLVALSCHVQRSIRPTMASSILLSCLN